MSSSENSSLEFLSESSSKNDNRGNKGTTNKKMASNRLVLEPTKDESKFHRKMFSELSDVLNVQINCTACGKNLNKVVAMGNEVCSHPQLLVLMCNKCSKFYGDGDFSVDEDGTVNYCRWCGQGGTLYCCSDCTSAFCKACLRRNLSKGNFATTESEDWKCLMCNCEPIWKNRGICWAALEYIATIQRKNKEKRLSNIQELIKKKEQIKPRSKNKRRRNPESDVSHSEDTKRQKVHKRTAKKDNITKSEYEEVKRSKRTSDESGSSDMEIETTKTRSNSYKKYETKNENRSNIDVDTIVSNVDNSKRNNVIMVSSDSEYSDICTNKSQRGNKSNLKDRPLHQKGKKYVSNDYGGNIKSNKHTTDKCKYNLENSSETGSDNKSSGNTRKEKKREYFEEVSTLTQDLKAAKKTCIWISEHLNDIINIGQVISNEAKKMLETNVSISKLTKCSQVNRVISNINLLTNLSRKNLRKVKYISNAAHIHWLGKVKSHTSSPKAKGKIINTDEETSSSEKPESNSAEETIQHCLSTDVDGSKLHEENVKNNSLNSHSSQRTCSNNLNESEIDNKSKEKEIGISERDSKEIGCDRLSSSQEKCDIFKSDSDEEKIINHTNRKLTELSENEYSIETNETKEQELDMVHVNEATDLIQSVDETDIVENNGKSIQENVKNNSLNSHSSQRTCSNNLNESEIDNKSKEKEIGISERDSKEIGCDRLSSSQEKCDIFKSDSDEEKIINHTNGKLTELSENEYSIETNETKEQESDMVHVNEATDLIQSVDETDIVENNGNSNTERKNKINAADIFLSTGSRTSTGQQSSAVNEHTDQDSTFNQTDFQDNLTLIKAKNDSKTFERKKEMGNKDFIAKESKFSEDTSQLHFSSCVDNTISKEETIEELHKLTTSEEVTDNSIESEIKSHNIGSCSNEEFHCAVSKEINSDTQQEQSVSQCPELREKCSDAKRVLLESSSDDCFSDDLSDLEHAKKHKVNKKCEQKFPSEGEKQKKPNTGRKNFKLFHNLSISSCSDSDCSSEKSGKEEVNSECMSVIESCQKCYVLLERLDSNLIEHLNVEHLKDVSETLPLKEDIKNKEDSVISSLVDCNDKLHNTDDELNIVNEDSEKDLMRLFNISSLKKNKRLQCSSTKINTKKKEKTVNDVSLLSIHNKIDEETDENGGYSCNQDSNIDLSKSFNEIETALETKKNKFAKEMLLLSNSDQETSDDQITPKKTRKKERKSTDPVVNKENIKNEKNDMDTTDSDISDGNKEKEKNKKKWRNDKLLKWRLSETDTSDEERQWKKKKDQQEKEINENDSDDRAFKSRFKRKKNIISSNSDDEKLNDVSDSSSSVGVFQLKKKRKHQSEDSDPSFKNSSASDGSIGKKKVKRKRIKKPVSDNSDNSSNDCNETQKSEGTPGKGRKNIRRLANVTEATKQAAREEEERKKRILEKQKLYYSIYKEVEFESIDKLILDFDPDTKEEIVKVHENIVRKLKPHQVRGVKFMWDACFESVEQIKTSKGSGCILAHCMGLGKTFQIVALVHSLLTHSVTNVKTVLVVCPLSTVLNWVNEFSVWLKDTPEKETIEVYEISKFKKNYERLYKLQEWQESGGVMVLGYDMYRNLANPAAKRVRKKVVDGFQTTLVDPGPDLIVCDEGHLLKNEDSAISKAMRRIKTLRRIVLTGTPLQNNLVEYHCMVQFVKPNLLGNRKEFNNRFVHPICNGQFEDSTAHDVRVMKRRAHVLHKMLEGSVQRFDYSVLTPFLPPKQEYVISVKLSDVQIKAYQYYLENYSGRQGQELDGILKPKGAMLFSDFQAFQRIWTHPRVMLMNAEKNETIAEKKRLYESDSEGSLKDFIVNGSDDSSSASESSEKNKSISDNDIEEVNKSDEEEATLKQSRWWEQFVTDNDFEDLRLSGKLVLLFSILQECEKIGDKVLVFSQSLFSLDLIEYFLNKIDDSSQKNKPDPFLNNHTGSWTFGLDYFRLDGSTSGENRSQWCKLFNKEENLRGRLFLISTRAGGLGINLVSANRVIIFDASWNPSHDVQSIFRVYRFGQKKPCYVYRFLAQGTMEEKIYDRQISKLSMARRVVDEHQIERHYNMSDLQELYKFNPEEVTKKYTPMLPKDRLFADLLKEHEQWIVTYHEHDSLLENIQEEELNEEERKAAWEDYENEKKGKVYAQSFVGPDLPQLNIQALRELIWKENPSITEEQLQQRVNSVLNYMVQYQTTNRLIDNAVDTNTQNQQFMYNEHQKTNIMESNPFMHYSYSPYYPQVTNIPTGSNLPNKVISTEGGNAALQSTTAPRIKVKSFGLMKDGRGSNSQLPNLYSQSHNTATWSAENSRSVQQTSQGNKKPEDTTNKDLTDDSIEIID